MQSRDAARTAAISAEDRVAARRERLLEAGLELFGTRGFDATGVKEICREARPDRPLLLRVVPRRPARCSSPSSTASPTSCSPRSRRRWPRSPPSPSRSCARRSARSCARWPTTRACARIVFSEAGGAGAEVELHMRATLRRFTALVAATARPHVGADVPDERGADRARSSLVGHARARRHRVAGRRARHADRRRSSTTAPASSSRSSRAPPVPSTDDDRAARRADRGALRRRGAPDERPRGHRRPRALRRGRAHLPPARAGGEARDRVAPGEERPRRRAGAARRGRRGRRDARGGRPRRARAWRSSTRRSASRWSSATPTTTRT